MKIEKRMLKGYPRYKESGTEWLGQMPDHWNISRAKSLWRNSSDKNHSEDQLLAATQKDGVVPRSSLDFRVWSPGEDLTGYKLVLPGDFVISLRSFEGGIEYSRHRGIISPAYVVLNARKKINTEYYRWFLKSDIAISFLNSLTTGIRQGRTIQYGEFAEMPCPQLPLEEAAQIANFLDRETAHLDGLIERKNRLLELLEEQRRAVISQAVTRGLNPDAPLKDSGVPWLGQVPREWDMQRLKNLSVFVTSGSRGWAEYYADDGSIFVRIGNLQRNSITPDLNDIQYVRVPLGAEGERTRIQEGDVLISITADLGSVVAASPALKDAYVSQHVALVRLNDGVEARWLAYSVMGDLAKSHFKMASYGGTKIQLSLEDVRETPVMVPSLEEQKVIAAYLDLETAKLDVLRQKLEQSIAHLREYRAALITAAVTGQIDVREEATQS